MSNTYANQLLAQYLSKKAAEEAGHEASEAPSMEMLEHAMGGQGEGEGEDSAEELLSQLSPEELEELAASLSGEMQDPSQDAGGEDVEALAQAIQQNLAQNPEASVEGAAPEQAEALDAIKSASYIEGFIKQALHTGLDIKQAVDMYDQALTETVESLQKFSGVKEMKDSTIKGVKDFAKKHLAGPATAAAGMYDSTVKGVDKHRGKLSGVAGLATGLAGGYGAAKLKSKAKKKEDDKKEEEKTAAYFEGVFEKAAEYGISEDEAYELLKSAAKGVFGAGAAAPRMRLNKDKTGPAAGLLRRAYVGAKRDARTAYRETKAKGKELYDSTAEKAKQFGDHLKDKKKYYISGAVGTGLAGAGAYAVSKYNKSKDSKEEGKQKSAEYIEGMYKRALEHGFSPKQAEQVVYNLLS